MDRSQRRLGAVGICMEPEPTDDQRVVAMTRCLGRRPATAELLASWVPLMLWPGGSYPPGELLPISLDDPNRSDPCPCGSGRKYKKCCGRDRRTRLTRSGRP